MSERRSNPTQAARTRRVYGLGKVVALLVLAMPLITSGSLAQQAIPVSLSTPDRQHLPVGKPAAPNLTAPVELSPSPLPYASPKLLTTFGRLPLSFEENQGQTDERVKFLASGRDYTLFLTPTEAVLALHGSTREAGGGKREAADARGGDSRSPTSREEGQSEGALVDPDATTGLTQETQSTVVRMRFEGANPNPAVTGFEKLPGIVNYFIGDDPEKWRTHIPTYKEE